MADAADARRRERRAAVRAYHPDVGGDPGALQAALLAIDRRYDATREPDAEAQASPVRIGRIRAGLRLVRERIPRGWPGHCRLIDLTWRHRSDDGPR